MLITLYIRLTSPRRHNTTFDVPLQRDIKRWVFLRKENNGFFAERGGKESMTRFIWVHLAYSRRHDTMCNVPYSKVPCCGRFFLRKRPVSNTHTHTRDTHAYTHAYTYTRLQHIHKRTHKHAHQHTFTQKQTHVHTRTNAHTNTHTSNAHMRMHTVAKETGVEFNRRVLVSYKVWYMVAKMHRMP